MSQLYKRLTSFRRREHVSADDIRQSYEVLLGREPSAEDIDFWTGAANDRNALQKAIRNSAEFIERSRMIEAGQPVMRIISEDEMLDFVDSFEAGADQHPTLELMTMRLKDAGDFAELDPGSTAYRARVLDVYRRLTREADYLPHVNERSRHPAVGTLLAGPNPARSLSTLLPYELSSTRYVGEFLTSWGAIFKALNLKAGADVLEYGPGTGQLAISLARTGLNTFVADIDQIWLDLIEAQARVLGLNIVGERAPFGEGFPDKTFDAIIFFEAFHHALDFETVIQSCRRKLKPGGKLILSGEPITQPGTASLPYPWGLRLDGLSVYCIRRFGWMELGFEESFLRSRFLANGWSVEKQDDPLFRAVTYIMRPIE